MVNDTLGVAGETGRDLGLLDAPFAVRRSLNALLALDRTLGQVLRTTRMPLAGQMRLAWWRQALAALDEAPPPAQPVLVALATEAMPRGVTGAALAATVDGWEALLAEPLDTAALETFADRRGGDLFVAMAMVLGDPAFAPVRSAGRGWALADLALHVTSAEVSAIAATMARADFDRAFGRAWPRALRPLGTLALSARADLAGVPPGSARRALRLIGHRLTGR